MMHVVVGSIGFAALILFTAVGYSDMEMGGLLLFIISASIVVYFISMFEMQNIQNSVWIRTNVPEHWLTQPSKEYFERYRRREAEALRTKNREKNRPVHPAARGLRCKPSR